MIRAAVVRSLRVFLTRAARRSSAVAPLAATSGIMLTPVSKPDSPRTSSGKASRAGPAMSPKPAAERGERVGPGGQGTGLGDGVVQSHADDHGVQQQEDGHQGDGDGHRFGEAEQEHAAQNEQQHHGDEHCLTLQEVAAGRGSPACGRWRRRRRG